MDGFHPRWWCLLWERALHWLSVEGVSSETQGDDLDYRSFGPNENYWFNSISKINEQRVILTSSLTFVLNIMYTFYEDLSPVFDFEQMKLVTWENVIDNFTT